METLEEPSGNLASGNGQENSSKSLLQARRDLEFGQTMPIKPEVINPDAPVQSVDQIKSPLPGKIVNPNQNTTGTIDMKEKAPVDPEFLQRQRGITSGPEYTGNEL